MADKTYNPPPLPPELSRCPRCGAAMVPHGVGNPTRDGSGTTWRYSCREGRRAWRIRIKGQGKGEWKRARTCTYTASIPVPPNPGARPGLAAELCEMAKEHKAAGAALRLIAVMVEAAANYADGSYVLDSLAIALPHGKIPQELKADLLELSNHACAAGLRPEMGLFRALAAQGFGPATVAVLRGFRSG